MQGHLILCVSDECDHEEFEVTLHREPSFCPRCGSGEIKIISTFPVVRQDCKFCGSRMDVNDSIAMGYGKVGKWPHCPDCGKEQQITENDKEVAGVESRGRSI